MNMQQKRVERGQSLVEITIVMPLILLLLGGLVEISNLLIAQNRVVTGTRAANSYGAVNFHEEKLPDGWSDSMAGVALNSVLNTPQSSSALWEFATVRAKTNARGDGFDRWDIEYPNETDSQHMPSEDQLQSRVLSELGGGASAGGLDLFITVASAQYDSLLNLDTIFSAYPSRLTALNVAMVDRDIEPVLVCVDENAGSLVKVEYAIDKNGAMIAPSGSFDVDYLTMRTWDGGHADVTYKVSNQGNRIVFAGGSLGEEETPETDHIKVLVSGAPGQMLGAPSGGGQIALNLVVGQTTTSRSGFTFRVSEVRPTGASTIVGLEISSGPEATGTLDQVILKFLGSECTEWGIPEDIGNYSASLDS